MNIKELPEMKLLVMVTSIIILLSACANQSISLLEQEALYENYVKQHNLIKLEKVTGFRFHNWKELDEKHLIISTGVKKHYYITLRTRCAGLRFSNQIGINKTGNILDARFDYIFILGATHQKCFIRSIHQLTTEQVNEVVKLGRDKD